MILEGAILLLALALRCWGLGDKSLWLDEATSWVFAQESLGRILTNTAEPNPPLYYALLHGWIKLFGASEISLRIPSVLAGVASVGLIGWVGRQLGGRRVGVLAMALMAVMPLPVQYAQMARTFSVFLALSLAAYGALLAWDRTGRRRWAGLYVAATVLSAYAHNAWIFNVIAQQAVMLPRVWRTGRLRAWLGINALAVAGIAPWFMVLLGQTAHIDQEGLRLAVPTAGDVSHILHDYLGFHAAEVLGWAMLVVTAVFALRSLARPRFADALLVAWLACPIIVPFALSYLLTPMLRARYTIAAAPALYLLIARGVIALPRPRLQAAAVAAFALLAAVGLRAYYGWEMENWRGIAGAAARMAQPGDALILSSTRPDPFLYYYRGRVPFVYPFEAQPARVYTAQDAEALQAQVRRAVAGHRRAWVLVRVAREQDFRDLLTAGIKREHPSAALIYERQFSTALYLYGFDLVPAVGGA